MSINPIKIIETYYKPESLAYEVLLTHSKLVTKKALEIASKVPELNPDLQFIEEAAMLHDIGMFLTHAPDIGCTGDKRYICHGVLGREILDKHRLYRHGIVCETHIGTGGLTIEDIENGDLPLPRREMVPNTIEEEIIAFADKFYTKKIDRLKEELSIDEITKKLRKISLRKEEIFEQRLIKFKYNS